jgi:hypothetical protein
VRRISVPPAEAEVDNARYDSDSGTTIAPGQGHPDDNLSRLTVSLYTGEVKIGLQGSPAKQYLAAMNQALVDNDLTTVITTPDFMPVADENSFSFACASPNRTRSRRLST